MPGLIACGSCSRHVVTVEAVCPHCGAPVRDAAGRVSRTAGALLMGLALAGCGDKSSDDDDNKGSTAGEPDYGVAATESYGSEAEYGVAETTGFPSDTETESEAGSSSGSGSTGGADEPTGSSSGTTGGEPMYGVPDTTTG